MRLLFLGDIVGRPGRTAVVERLPRLRERWSLDLVVINGENAAGGFGITEAICDEVLAAGADVITLGNHSFDQREALVFIERQPRLLRPANYPRGTPGRGATVVEARNGARVLVMNVMGRLFMDPLDDPFTVVAQELEACPLGAACDAVVIDMHAEATSEKQGLAAFVDGRASLVVGTHTHVPTADGRVLPGGTGYLSDAGMCGDYDSILGMQKDEPIRRFLEKTPGSRLEAASGEGTLAGIAVETDDATGLAHRVAHVRIGPHLAPSGPDFWE
ncbi:metallophosphoesterase, MG_246/BB_0505 family [Chelatococcus sambhunathii]|uniref:Metallophosphoesterase n=2 Tax=Chelatococcus TaxID=28209 RepID=A0AAC9JTT0_9HYPH|nr:MULTISPECIES: TIGR00282 family metallophosphoesterase [Chelatococcus]APF38265.1 metallophosphoesterase [Chelatococcus daeguensis]CUA84600.1 metallophosphoesterase, MG_246/BB_0505 family [Chelatococcus sambhunathii]